MPDNAALSLFGPGIDILLSPDWENIGLPAAMETVWAVLRAAQLKNIQGPITITPPTPPPTPPDNIPPQPEEQKDPVVIKINRPALPPVEITLEDLAGGGGGDGSGGSRLVTIKTIKKDGIIVNDPADPDFQGVTIAKPRVLCGTQTAKAPVTSYEITDTPGSQERTVHLEDDINEEQVVLPKYVVGDKLVIMNLPVPVVIDGSSELPLSAGVTWIDVNVDARAWATKIPTDQIVREATP